MMKSRKMYYQSNLNTASYPKQGVFDWRLSRLTQPPTISEACLTDDEADISGCGIVAKRLSGCRWDVGWSEWVMDAEEESGEFMRKSWTVMQRTIKQAHSAFYRQWGMFDRRWGRSTQPPTLSEACFTDDEVDRSGCGIVAKWLSACRWDVDWSEWVMDAEEESGEFTRKSWTVMWSKIRGVQDGEWCRR